MDERSNSFGYWLRRRRRALDLTQRALAEKVSCSEAAIKKIEAEERRPSRSLAQRLADQLGVLPQERQAFIDASRQLAASGLPPFGSMQEPHPVSHESPAPDQQADPKSAFVGRDPELADFVGRIARLPTGRGHVVLVQGEPGIGKSRLLHEVFRHVQARSIPAVRTNCYEIERSIAYQPVIELATQACEKASDARLRLIAPVLLAEIAALAPVVATRLPNLPTLSTDVPQARQARLFRALVHLLDAAANDGQLLVAIDDLQWADDASLQFLHFLARQVGSHPILLALAYRDEDLAGNQQLCALVESVRREPTATRMALERLPQREIEALLREMNDPRLGAPDLAARLHRETAGNPFFLWSIVHSLSEGAGESGDAATLPLPEALRDSVRARLTRVPQEERRLLEVAAVLGRRFDFETLLALTGAAEEDFLRTLDSLLARRLLREEGEAGLYDFSHDKVREVVYRDIGVARRVLLHRSVAELLEQDAAANAPERDSHLAEHYERGKVWPKAVHYLGLAAARSQALFAMRESLQSFDRAVALFEAHPEAVTEAHQLALYERRGAARAQAGQTDGAVADFQRVIGRARALGQHERACDVLIQLGMAYRRADSYEQAVACLDEALTASRATGDERHVADTLYHLGTVAWSNGRNDLAIGYHQEAVDICERLGLGDLVAVQAFHGRGEAHFANGEPAAAVASFGRSLELARVIGDRSYESENMMMMGWGCTGHMGLGDYPAAMSHFDAALAIARSADLQWHLGPTLIGRAYVLSALGRPGEAWADLNEALPRLATLGLVRYQMMAHDAMGCVLLDLNLAADAAQQFASGLALADGAAIRYWRPRLQANLAIAQLRTGIPHDASALLEASRYARDHSEGWLRLRCLEALAEAALAKGDTRDCMVHAGELLAAAEAGEMLEEVARARLWRGLAWLSMAEYGPAGEELTRSVTVAETIGNVRLAWDGHLALARVADALGDPGARHARRTHATGLAAQIANQLRGSGLASNLAPEP